MQINTHTLKFDTVPPCRLIPVTSLNTSRYDNSASVQPCSWAVGRGPISLSSVSGPVSRWQRFVHPEGKPYFALIGEFDFAVVTGSNVEDLQTEGRISDCAKIANKELKYRNINVPFRCELFLDLGDSEDDASCKYYFVDHAGKRLFWLEDLNTELLDIPAPTSHWHLELALGRLYWAHVEFFPMHHDSHEQSFSQMVDDLYDIISHGQVDGLTSRTPTSLYTADTCKQVLKRLWKKRGQRVNGYTLRDAARLASVIMNQRLIAFYGPRLDRLQKVYPVDEKHKWLLIVANLLMWSIPKHYIRLLESLYVNEHVSADQWTRFISICLTDWANSLSWGFGAFMASILLANMRGGTASLSIPSVAFCVISIVSAFHLRLRNRSLMEASATAATRYLQAAKSNALGFLLLSVKFSLPKAGFLWGVGLLTVHFFFIVYQVVNRLIALMAASVIVIVLVFVNCVTNPEPASILIRPLALLYFRLIYG